MAIGTSLTAIVAELQRRGERFSIQNIANHRQQHWRPEDRYQEVRERIVERLKKDAENPNPVLAALSLGLAQQVEGLITAKATPENLVRTAEALSKASGLDTKKQLLMLFIEEKTKPRTEVVMGEPVLELEGEQ